MGWRGGGGREGGARAGALFSGEGPVPISYTLTWRRVGRRSLALHEPPVSTNRRAAPAPRHATRSCPRQYSTLRIPASDWPCARHSARPIARAVPSELQPGNIEWSTLFCAPTPAPGPGPSSTPIVPVPFRASRPRPRSMPACRSSLLPANRASSGFWPAPPLSARRRRVPVQLPLSR